MFWPEDSAPKWLKWAGIFSAAAAAVAAMTLTGPMAAAVGLLSGLALLKYGSSMLIDHALNIAHKLRIPPVLAGIVLLGFGTSSPELASSVGFIGSGADAEALINVAGSNFSNYWLILPTAVIFDSIRRGLGRLFSGRKRNRSGTETAFQQSGAETTKHDPGTVGVGKHTSLVDKIFFPAAFLALAAFAFIPGLGGLTPVVGKYFMYGLGAYILARWGESWLTRDKTAAQEAEHHGAKSNLLTSLAMAGLGFGLLVLGANLMVGGGLALAALYHWAPAVVGLISAVGTSLPELTVSIAALAKGRHDLAAGNLIGSNIFNILGVLGVGMMVKGGALALTGALPMIGVMALSSMAVTAMMLKDGKIGPGTAALMLGAWTMGTLGILGVLAMPVAMPVGLAFGAAATWMSLRKKNGPPNATPTRDPGAKADGDKGPPGGTRAAKLAIA